MNLKEEQQCEIASASASESSESEVEDATYSVENSPKYGRFKVVGDKVGGMANEYVLVAKRNWRKSTFFVRVDFFYKLVLLIAALKIIFDMS